MKYQPFKWLIWLVVLFCISSCTSRSSKIPINGTQVIDSGLSFGQSFTAQNRGLTSISIMLAPGGSSTEGSLLFHLRASPLATEDIATARLPIREITKQAYYRFDFPTQSDSQRKDYFLLMEVDGDGQVELFTAQPDSYLDGALYKNLEAQNAQLSFQLEYNRQAYLLGAISLIVSWIPVVFFGIIIFILPGWALFSLLWRGWNEVNWISKLGLSAALSLSIYPLFLLWTDLIGLHLGPLYALIPPIAGFLILLLKNWKSFSKLPRYLSLGIYSFHRSKALPIDTLLADIAFVIIIGLVIASRFWIIRSLDVPLFGDSYQHTMISQLIIDHGGLFNSWEPYADLVTFTYHFGFHSAVAVYHWISGVPVEQSVLWTGQLMNIFAILGLYPLTYQLTKNRWAAVLSILVGGLLTSMPNFYVNWGRYTQLAGQVILPVIIWIAWSLFERPIKGSAEIPFFGKFVSFRYLSIDFTSLIITWLVLGGLALTHYRILLLGILFFPAYGLLSIFRKRIISWVGRTFWMGIGGVILILPWFIRVFGGKIMDMFVTGITTIPSELSGSTAVLHNFNSLVVYLPRMIWIFILLAILLAPLGKHLDFIIFTIWWVLIVLATNPNWLGLPGMGIITNFAVQIAFYFPAGVAVGFTLSWIAQKVQNIPFPPKFQLNVIGFNAIALVVICSIGLWSLPQRINDLNLPSYALVTRPDLRAMRWIKENLPIDAKFLVNSFFAYNNRVVAGSDGGWWIPLIADRKTSLPPLTYGFELGVGSATTDTANSLVREIQEKGIENPDIISRLVENGIQYIYIGQRQGTVNYSGPQVLDPEVIKTIDHFKVAYHQDRVWIFALKP